MPRRPTPTNILAARGAIRAGQRQSEPDFTIDIPDCPAWITSPEAREWFREQAEDAAEAGIMARPHGTALAGAAFFLQEFIECEKAIREQGRTAVSESGAVYQHPLIGIRNKAWDKVVKMLIEFGFTPAARSTIKVGAVKAAADSLESFNAEERQA